MELLAPFYETIYIIIVLIYTMIYVNKKVNCDITESIVPSLLLCVFMVLFVGLRPIHPVFADMIGYAQYYQDFDGEVVFKWTTTGSVLFDFMTDFLAKSKVSISIYFTIIAALYFIPMLIACRKLFPQATMLSFLVCLGAFSTFSYGTNGIRAGIAGSIFLLALAYREKIWLVSILMFMSWGFHHSMSMPIAAFVITLFFKKTKWYFGGWLFCLVLSLAHILYFQELFSSLADDKSAKYLTYAIGWEGRTGFRLDFLIYSIVPVFIGYLVKFKHKLKDSYYDNILNLYLVTNGIWLLCMYAEFTNRIAYLSWFLYPILIIYPFISILDTKHPLVAKRKLVVYGHLFFTIFMMIYVVIR